MLTGADGTFVCVACGEEFGAEIAMKSEESMERVRIVNSSNIKEAGYDPATQVLEVVFADGRTYCFLDVPQEVAGGLFRPPFGSSGDYFHTKINRRYEYIRL